MKAVVFYYSQSGQAREVAQSIGDAIEEVVYKEIVPSHSFPFPWSRRDFFEVFPETRLGIPPFGIQPVDFSDIQDANTVIIVGQSWFLSPSLPIQSFFLDDEVKAYLQGRDIVFVNACRNMWVMTLRNIKAYVGDCGANLVGHVVLQDPHANLVSALTVVRWLMHGKKESGMMLPESGLSKEEINSASRFGKIVSESVNEGKTACMQDMLLGVGAIEYKPSIAFIEKVGHRIFGIWARFIQRKGGYGDKHRQFRLDCFYYYLLFVLFVMSPFAQFFFYLTYPIHRVGRERRIAMSVRNNQ